MTDSQGTHERCKRWLVIRLGHLGDVALTTGVLAKLGKEFNWTFTVMTKKPWADIFAGNPHVENVISLDAPHFGVSGFVSLSMRLAAEYSGWGLLDLHGTLRSRVLSAFWRGPVLRYPKMSLDRRIFLRMSTRRSGERLRRTP